MDLEMTGLEPERHVIVEIATLHHRRPSQHRRRGSGPRASTPPPSSSPKWVHYVTEMHTKSGLLAQDRLLDRHGRRRAAQTLEFLNANNRPRHGRPLCGNSIGTDRRFLQEYMPELEAFFHYRNVDVSTHEGAGASLVPGVRRRDASEKESAHRALDDIRESIDELVALPRRRSSSPSKNPPSPADEWRRTPSRLEDATAQLDRGGPALRNRSATIVTVAHMTVWKHAPANLVQLLDLSLQHATKDFLVYEDRRYTFDEHYRVVVDVRDAAARARRQERRPGGDGGAQPARVGRWPFGERVITGAVVVPLNAWWTPDELVYGLNDSGSSVLFVDEERLDRLVRG